MKCLTDHACIEGLRLTWGAGYATLLPRDCWPLLVQSLSSLARPESRPGWPCETTDRLPWTWLLRHDLPQRGDVRVGVAGFDLGDLFWAAVAYHLADSVPGLVAGVGQDEEVTLNGARNGGPGREVGTADVEADVGGSVVVLCCRRIVAQPNPGQSSPEDRAAEQVVQMVPSLKCRQDDHHLLVGGHDTR